MPEGLVAHLSFTGLVTLPRLSLGLPLHGTAIARQEIVPGLAEGAARHILQGRQSQGWGYWRVSDAVSGMGRRSEESTGLQSHWGGGVSPRQEGVQ